MAKSSDYLEIGYASIKVFSDDGTLDMSELNFLLGIALKDGQVDADEKDALKRIFSKIVKSDVTPKVWERIKAIREKYAF